MSESSACHNVYLVCVRQSVLSAGALSYIAVNALYAGLEDDVANFNFD